MNIISFVTSSSPIPCFWNRQGGMFHREDEGDALRTRGQIDRKPKECVDACGCMFHPQLKTGIHTPIIPCTSVLRFDEQI